MNIKNYVPGEVRLDQARYRARAAFGKAKVIVEAPASDAYREGWERVFGKRYTVTEVHGAKPSAIRER